MKKSTYLLAASLVIAGLSAFTLSPLGDNLLLNPGFETGEVPWSVWGGLEIDKEIRHSGEASCRIVAQKDGWRATAQTIKLPEGAEILKVSCWMKTDNIIPNGEPWNNARVSLQFLKSADEKDKINEDFPAAGEASGTTDWKKHGKLFYVPDEAKYAYIILSCGKATGTAWFDDLEMKVIDCE